MQPRLTIKRKISAFLRADLSLVGNISLSHTVYITEIISFSSFSISGQELDNQVTIISGRVSACHSELKL